MANFKVHARVLDLLGEEQIADCPTAISELFKNAYDAYASNVSLDIYTKDNHAVLWDNGAGMSEQDLLSRWLVVGTPGKKIDSPVPDRFDIFPRRPVMGEKGIGRLAISTLGDTLFLVSKQSIDGVAEYTALLINWNIVRNDRLLLSDIYVPVITFSDLADLDSGIADDMVQSFLAPILRPENAKLWEGAYERRKAIILDQLERFKLDLAVLRRTGIETVASGTWFYIADLVPDLPLYVRAPNRDDNDRDTPQAMLVQLLGSFKARVPADPPGVSQRDSEKIVFHADVRTCEDVNARFRSVFDDWETFNEDELLMADHHIKIDFDEFGRYSGVIRRYEETIPLPLVSIAPKFDVSCGPFSLEFWYWQGDAGETRLTTEQKVNIDKKLGLFGGLLLYRDDLRVLPYGRPEFDWLKIEERRSLQAGRHFFSYRRMFGAVSITRGQNPLLRDKAGREGLKLNKEYRDFRKALIGFLSAAAREYFGESAEFKMKKAEVEAHQALLKADEKKVAARRKKLTLDLEKRLAIIQSGQTAVRLLLNNSLEELRAIADPGSEEKVVKINMEFESKLSRLEEQARFSISRNLSVGKSGKLRKLKHDYEDEWPRFRDLCMSMRKEFSYAITAQMPDVALAAIRRKSIENALFQGRAKIGRAHSTARATLDEMEGRLESFLDDLKRRHLDRLESSLLASTFAETVEQAQSSRFGDLPLMLGAMEQAVAEAVEEASFFDNDIGEHFDVFFERTAETISAIRNDEIEELREQVSQNLELVQLGLSVEIIDHDLQKAYHGIRTSLASLHRLWKEAPRSLTLLRDLTANFQHLEQRYQMMSPLYRKSYKAKVRLSGREIFDYVKNFLGHELEIHDVTLNAQASFLDIELFESPGRVLPVFINLVDNAIFWVRDAATRLVELGFIDNTVTINDSGPGIHPTMLTSIFTAFVSEKPSGRGLGLYIARANLEVVGHKIWATLDLPYRTMSGACICIKFNANAIKPEEQ
jgi:signal transduction histidine kinase